FDRLAARFNPIVMEGAGSMTELNLRDVDIVNLPMAAHAGANVILVADIDRGGVFASAYGSIALLTPEERRMVKGIIINKFRGDIRLFESGVRTIEQLCGVPVLGVIPYYKDIYIEEEDSVQLAVKSVTAERGRINVAVILLRHLSNFTDFNVLERDPRVHLFYTNNTAEIAKADIIILPGSKCTVDDLCELRRNGVAQAVVKARREGATVLGICGGYQMMGMEVLDTEHVESDIERVPGLGLLPTSTLMTGTKITRQVRFTVDAMKREDSANDEGFTLKGYEIHMGTTTFTDGGGGPKASCLPLARLDDGQKDGCIADERCMGTYIHGILDNPDFIDFLLRPYTGKLDKGQTAFDYAAFKNEQYDKLADHVRRHIDMELVYRIMKGLS
ncbi:MAG: cobyric acid synthase, partial [Prevotella sp.]